METGRVKWFSDEMGYGFIEVDGRTDVFVHYSDIDEGMRSLDEGNPVSFEIERGDKTDRARGVHVAESA